MTKKDLSPALREIHRLIQQGSAEAARARLGALARHRLPRGHLVEAAALARRAGVAELGVRWLNSVTRASSRTPMAATLEERAEYAVCLGAIGAVQEGQELIEALDPKRENTRITLYKAFLRAGQWQYAATIPLLLEYIAREKDDEYLRLVAKVNLAAALVFERDEVSATALLRELVHETGLRRYRLLHGNVLELATENFILRRSWTQAERTIGAARELLRGTGGRYSLIAEKWAAILALYHPHRKDSEARARLAEVREKAVALPHWETVRDCDRFLAVTARDQALLTHLLVGTPYESFRLRLRAEAGRALALPMDYLRCFAGAGEGAPVLDLGQSSPLTAGSVPHRLALALSSDFYRPFPVATLFHLLHPDELFSPQTSPNRIHQAIRALRTWLARREFPLQVEESHGCYRWAALGPCRIHLFLTQEARDPDAHALDKLRSLWPSRAFTARDAGEVLGVSARTALRLLVRGVEQGRVDRLGKRSDATYRFTKEG